ncbi:hypothetical protein NQ415_001996 [Listeria monocytogenes]|uniref:hypothetical protein n=1 Tax=Listeria innocua TaxID=1642 RepID=UPI00162A4620|nr:hypothetical protein [Listeria innocua]MBC2143701.1 hypothetical protein [Listeria innocua]HBM3436794.1 hypothetical protein [Listeria innocua]HDT2073632.1 hypothetical protein [Listeria innocua]
MTKYYRIEKGTKAYEYLDKIYNQDTDAFLNEVTELLGFEARGHIAINRAPLIIDKKALKEFKPEWMPKFKKYKGELMTPKTAFKELINAYEELQQKYNMDMTFRNFNINNALAGKTEVIYDFDNSGLIYFESARKILKEDFKEITDVEYIKRNLECAIWKKERASE